MVDSALHEGRAELRGPVEGPDAGACRPKPLPPSFGGNGLCSLAVTAAERNLLARLDFTSFQRRAAALHSCHHPAGAASAHWFRNAIGGIRVGISEGVILRGEGTDIAGWAQDVAAANGCSILRLVTAAEGELPEDAGSRAESLGGPHGPTVTRVRMKLREVLQLAPSWDDTLAGLGRHTRRNVRNARKAAAAAGIAFSFLEDTGAIPDGLLRMLAKKTEPHPISSRRLRVFEAYADQAGRAFRSVLRDADGTVISYCCGYLALSTAYLVYQLNDCGRNDIGPSLMHRAFLIEALIQQSIGELVFVHGCSGILRHSCIPMVADHYWVMHRTPAARLRAVVLANLQPNHLLGKVARAALQST